MPFNQRRQGEYRQGAAVGSPSREYIYSGAQLLATVTGSGPTATTTYHHADHLSVRVGTDGTTGSPTFGQKIGEQGHYPYGEAWYAANTTTKFLFTSYERDGESGLDYAMARYYDSRVARFRSADPVEGSPQDPQSWNRYAYVRNDPVNMTDPNGTFWHWLFHFLIKLILSLFGKSFISHLPGGHISLGTPPTFPTDGSGFDWHTLLPGHNIHHFGTPPFLPSGTAYFGPGAYVDQAALDKCTRKWFGVKLLELNESRPGQNGSFAGEGPDTIFNGGNDANIYVINDVTTYDSRGLRQLSKRLGGRPPSNVFVVGLTDPNNPYRNFTASNFRGAAVMARTQVHELGNSLQMITGAAFNPATVQDQRDPDPGQLLQECVEGRGGFRSS